MKVTSFEISKKLAEIGFRADFDWCYNKNDQNKSNVWSKSFEITCWEGEDISNYYPAYDLETIIDALPNQLVNENIFFSRLNYFLKISKDEIWYETECFCDSSEYCPVKRRMEIEKLKNESLADTAARLLIKLHEAGLVKFEQLTKNSE